MAMTDTSLLGLRTVVTSGNRDREGAYSRQIWRRLGTIAIAAALLPGCVNTKFKTDAPKQGFVTAEEPRAATVGRDMLAQGGSAGDAATAMALALTASLPSRAGLGGGGVCLVFDAAKKETRTLDFLPRPAGAGGAAMPAMLRGLYALHAATGTLRWEQVAVPAEQIARESGVSRAFAQDLAAAGNALGQDEESKRLFLAGGAPPKEGMPFRQMEFADTLSTVRRTGVGAFYGGPMTAMLAQGLGIEAAALRAYQPRWTGTRSIPLDLTALHFAALPGTETMVQAWNTATGTTDPAERAARIGRALGTPAQARTTASAVAPGVGILAIDPQENAVACTFTQGALFGTGRMVPGTGILAARGVEDASFGVPALETNAIVGRTMFAGTGTATGNDGPAAAATALLSVALPAVQDRRSAGAILTAREASAPGRASIIACQTSPENGLKSCQPAADPRTHGLGYLVEVEDNAD